MVPSSDAVIRIVPPQKTRKVPQKRLTAAGKGPVATAAKTPSRPMIMNVWSCTESDTISLAAQDDTYVLGGQERGQPRIKQEPEYGQDGGDHQQQLRTANGPGRSEDYLPPSTRDMSGMLSQGQGSDGDLITLMAANVTTTNGVGGGYNQHSSPVSRGGRLPGLQATMQSQQKQQQQQRESIIVKWGGQQAGGSTRLHNGDNRHLLVKGTEAADTRYRPVKRRLHLNVKCCVTAMRHICIRGSV